MLTAVSSLLSRIHSNGVHIFCLKKSNFWSYFECVRNKLQTLFIFLRVLFQFVIRNEPLAWNFITGNHHKPWWPVFNSNEQPLSNVIKGSRFSYFLRKKGKLYVHQTEDVGWYRGFVHFILEDFNLIKNIMQNNIERFKCFSCYTEYLPCVRMDTEPIHCI